MRLNLDDIYHTLRQARYNKTDEIAITINTEGIMCKHRLNDNSSSPEEKNKVRVVLNNIKTAIAHDNLSFLRFKPNFGCDYDKFDIIVQNHEECHCEDKKNVPTEKLLNGYIHDDDSICLYGTVMIAFNLKR
jgi:hypothetical protein